MKLTPKIFLGKKPYKEQEHCFLKLLINTSQGRIQGGQLGGVEAKIGRKWANFARFWPILGGWHPQAPLLDPPLLLILGHMDEESGQEFSTA